MLSATKTIESKNTFVGKEPPFVIPKAAPELASKVPEPVKATVNTAVLPFGIAPLAPEPVNTLAPSTAVAAHRPLADSLVCLMMY